MSARPTHKTVTCPECGKPFDRAIVWFEGREIMADRGCLCDACEASRAAAVAAASEKARIAASWSQRVPEDYLRASEDKVPPRLRDALRWKPSEGCRRLGIYGPPGDGKTMAAALLTRNLAMWFQWTNGFALRSVYVKASSSPNDEERRENGRKWERYRDAPLLVLDDVDKGNFTEAWAGALFDLLEYRNGALMTTVWTGNLGPGQLAKKIAKCGDQEQADAIERRLCQGAKLFNTALK